MNQVYIANKATAIFGSKIKQPANTIVRGVRDRAQDHCAKPNPEAAQAVLRIAQANVAAEFSRRSSTGLGYHPSQLSLTLAKNSMGYSFEASNMGRVNFFTVPAKPRQ